MKKLTLALSAAVALGAGGSALASDTQSLIVDGTIQSVCTLTVSPLNVIALEDQNWQKVADITGACNSGLSHVKVRYTFTDFDNGSGYAHFMHDSANPSEYVAYRARVSNPAGVYPLIGFQYSVNQLNGSPYALEFRPEGTSSNIAGDYTTELTVNVIPS